jgi:hypothetical protein
MLEYSAQGRLEQSFTVENEKGQPRRRIPLLRVNRCSLRCSATVWLDVNQHNSRSDFLLEPVPGATDDSRLGYDFREIG